MDNKKIDIRNYTVNTIRVLAAETVQKANSGHPGICLGAAPIAYSLFQNALKFNPKDAKFVDRDRFVLSAGHGSALLYTLLHLYGYNVTAEDLQNFRQFQSKTPGHPELGVTEGVEISTGPLGQGIANAVGFAIAEASLAARFNKKGYKVVDHYTYALCGDGCLQEGISYEAASVAGNLELGKLIVLYDRNKITIEGNTDLAFTEDVGARFAAQNWQVIDVKDGRKIDDVVKAIKKAKAETKKPSIIICHTTIGEGSAKAGSESTHGSPLGDEGIKTLRANLGYEVPAFEIADEVKEHVAMAGAKGATAQAAWNLMMEKYSAEYPDDYKAFTALMSEDLPQIDTTELYNIAKADATRSHGGNMLNKIAPQVPKLFGGSADLAPSTKAIIKADAEFSAKNYAGKKLHFGIREHAMAAICNGLAAHGGFIPYCSTFFVFSDYMKNAMRLSALMDLNVLYILTHDSIGVGEDGPTHEPIEQLAALRTMPNMRVYRPCDGKETAACYVSALTTKGPSTIVLSRQTLAEQEKSGEDALKGGYIISNCKGNPDLIFIATGSEVDLCIKAQADLKVMGFKVRVVSMPCVEIFEQQTAAYKEKVIPAECRKRICVEAGATATWYKYAGLDGKVIGIDEFGASAPSNKLFEYYGLTAEKVKQAAFEMLK